MLAIAFRSVVHVYIYKKSTMFSVLLLQRKKQQHKKATSNMDAVCETKKEKKSGSLKKRGREEKRSELGGLSPASNLGLPPTANLEFSPAANLGF